MGYKVGCLRTLGHKLAAILIQPTDLSEQNLIFRDFTYQFLDERAGGEMDGGTLFSFYFYFAIMGYKAGCLRPLGHKLEAILIQPNRSVRAKPHSRRLHLPIPRRESGWRDGRRYPFSVENSGQRQALFLIENFSYISFLTF